MNSSINLTPIKSDWEISSLKIFSFLKYYMFERHSSQMLTWKMIAKDVWGVMISNTVAVPKWVPWTCSWCGCRQSSLQQSASSCQTISQPENESNHLSTQNLFRHLDGLGVSHVDVDCQMLELLRERLWDRRYPRYAVWSKLFVLVKAFISISTSLPWWECPWRPSPWRP